MTVPRQPEGVETWTIIACRNCGVEEYEALSRPRGCVSGWNHDYEVVDVARLSALQAEREQRVEVERRLDEAVKALGEIAGKTYATQWDEPSGAAVRFASELHHIARAALEPNTGDPERGAEGEAPSTERSSTMPDMPNPSDAQRATPEFAAVWNVIKSWDVNVPEFYEGYCGANGSHVALILNALGIDGSASTERS